MFRCAFQFFYINNTQQLNSKTIYIFFTQKEHGNFDGKEGSPTKICKEIESKQLVLYIVDIV